jgi:hypothetical protein
MIADERDGGRLWRYEVECVSMAAHPAV